MGEIAATTICQSLFSLPSPSPQHPYLCPQAAVMRIGPPDAGAVEEGEESRGRTARPGAGIPQPSREAPLTQA